MVGVSEGLDLSNLNETTADEIKATGDAVQKIVERLRTRKSEYAVA